MNLLPFFNVGIKLCYAPQSKLVHEINGIRLFNEFLTKGFDGHGEGSAKKADLVISIAKCDDLFEHGLEFWRE